MMMLMVRACEHSPEGLGAPSTRSPSIDSRCQYRSSPWITMSFGGDGGGQLCLPVPRRGPFRWWSKDICLPMEAKACKHARPARCRQVRAAGPTTTGKHVLAGVQLAGDGIA